MIASGLPISGESPKLLLSEANVGPAALRAPTRAVSTRAITPLPARVGPISSRILCRSVRPEMTYPMYSCNAAIASGASGHSSSRNLSHRVGRSASAQ